MDHPTRLSRLAVLPALLLAASGALAPASGAAAQDATSARAAQEPAAGKAEVVISAPQPPAPESPRAADVATLDGILAAYYEVVSGPAGQPRQWARDDSLHDPQAQVAVVENGEGTRTATIHLMSLAEFHAASSSLAEHGFFEREIQREVQTHGAVTHVWSTYEWRATADGPVRGRGVNSIQLVHDGERWWITSWIFDGRHPAPPVPARYLPAATAPEDAAEASPP